MKKHSILFFIACTVQYLCHAQLYIEPGAAISTTGHAVITLQNINLINHGTYMQATGGITVFNGSRNDSIQGSVQPNFDSLELAKSGGGKLVMEQSIGLNNVLKFSSGLLDLHGNTVLMLSTAVLSGESEASHATDTVLKGSLRIQQLLNAPSAVNPGNLGAIITSGQNLGSTTISRTHSGSIIYGSSTIPTVYRQFQISPANNTGVNGTLRCTYLDAELHDLVENELLFFKSTTAPYTVFTKEDYSSRDGAANYVEKTGISDFSLWALGDEDVIFPLKLLSFGGQCQSGSDEGTTLHWTTANEQNVSHLLVQQSEDGLQWKTIGRLNYRENVHDYTFNSKSYGSYYRLSIVDLDGSMDYSAIVHLRCDIGKEHLSLYPNPTNDIANLEVTAQNASLLQVKIIAANGVVVSSINRQLQPGSQVIPLHIKQLPAGTYFVNSYWGNGKYNKTIQLVKQ